MGHLHLRDAMMLQSNLIGSDIRRMRAPIMAEHSTIEWTDHTFNPWWGCTKVSPACDHCYAEVWAKRTGHDVWGAKAPRRFLSDATWEQPVAVGTRRRGAVRETDARLLRLDGGRVRVGTRLERRTRPASGR